MSVYERYKHIKFLRWNFENWNTAYFKTLIIRTVVSIKTSQQDRQSENVGSTAGRGKSVPFLHNAQEDAGVY